MNEEQEDFDLEELDELMLTLLDCQTDALDAYKDLIAMVDDPQLKKAFLENFRELADNHKEIIYHFNEYLDSEPFDDEEDDFEDEGDSEGEA